MQDAGAQTAAGIVPPRSSATDSQDAATGTSRDKETASAADKFTMDADLTFTSAADLDNDKASAHKERVLSVLTDVDRTSLKTLEMDATRAYKEYLRMTWTEGDEAAVQDDAASMTLFAKQFTYFALTLATARIILPPHLDQLLDAYVTAFRTLETCYKNQLAAARSRKIEADAVAALISLSIAAPTAAHQVALAVLSDESIRAPIDDCASAGLGTNNETVAESDLDTSADVGPKEATENAHSDEQDVATTHVGSDMDQAQLDEPGVAPLLSPLLTATGSGSQTQQEQQEHQKQHDQSGNGRRKRKHRVASTDHTTISTDSTVPVAETNEDPEQGTPSKRPRHGRGTSRNATGYPKFGAVLAGQYPSSAFALDPLQESMLRPTFSNYKPYSGVKSTTPTMRAKLLPRRLCRMRS
ncbi:hypothetical protein GGF32_005726 [Allomyces javanicus]|nr:hypothetical protein GGF32_005726 [Allomyces javanicus]